MPFRNQRYAVFGCTPCSSVHSLKFTYTPLLLPQPAVVGTLGRIRTAGLDIRIVALCSAELRGQVIDTCERRDSNPLSVRNRVTAGPNSPTLARSRDVLIGCLTGVEPVPPESQSGALPLSYSHHGECSYVPAEGLEPPIVGV